MSDTSGIINRVRFDSAVATNSADVVVKGFSNNALQGILEAISKTNSVLNDLQSDLDEIQSDNDKRAQADEKKNKNEEKNRVASLASERRSRATNAAIYGEIQRGNIFNKMLREGLMEALSGLTDFLKDNLHQSLKSIQSLSAVMRKANLSQSDKDKVQRKAGDALGDVKKYFNGLRVSRDEVNSYFGDLLADGKDITALTAEQTASYVALRKSGLAADKAYVAAMTTSAKDLEKPINSLRMPGVAQAMNTAMENVTSAQIAAMGGWDKAMNSFSENSRQYVETLRMSGVATGDAADMITGYTMAQHGLYDQMSDQQRNAAVFYKGSMADTANALKDASETLKLGARTGVLPDSYANIALMTDAGVSTGQRIYTDEEVGKANKVNTDKGIVQTGIDRLVAGVDKFTGGAISTMTNRLDELFGDSADITKIVGTGFTIVTGLLGSIVASKLVKNPAGLFASLGVIIPNAFGKIKGFFKKDDKPKTPKTPKVPRDLDKEYKEAISKLKQINFENFKNKLSEKFDAFKAAAMNTKDSAKNAFDSFKQQSDKMWSHAKSSFSSIRDKMKPRAIFDSAKSAFSDIKKRGVVAMTKIPGMFKGIGNKIGANAGKIGKGILGGIGIASGALSLLGATGAFDSLTPIFNDFLNNLAPVLKELVDTLAPTIQSLLTSLGPSIQDIVRSLAPILDHTLKVVAPILTKVIQSLVPIIDSVFKSLMPLLDSVFKTLAPVLDSLVQTLMPIFSSIVETLMPIIRTSLDIFTPILSTFLSSLGPAIKIMANIWTPILEAIGSVLKGVAPIFTAVLKPIAATLEFLLTPLNLIAKLLNEESNTDGSGEAATAEENAKKNGDSLTANNAAKVRTAYSQGFDKIERQVGESDKDYYARAIKALEEESNKSSFTVGNKHRRENLKGILENTTSENANQKITEALLESIKNDQTIIGNTKKDDFYGKDIEDWREMSPSSLVTELKKVYGDDKNSIKEAVKLLLGEESAKTVELANGGIFNQATNAIIGEDGREVVLPLTKQSQLLRVLSSLRLSESEMLLKSILASKNFSDDNLVAAFSKYVEPISSPSQVVSRSGAQGDDSLSKFISKFIAVDQATNAEQIESNSLVREYIEAVKAVRSSSSNKAKQAAAQFSKTALSLLGNKSSSPEILAALNAVIKYLRDIASSPANKKVISSASRPVSTSY